MPRKCGGKEGGEGGSGAQKRGPAPSPPDAVGANKKTSTPSTSDRSTKTKTTNLNLAQGTTVDALRTATSYFDKGWNAFAQQKDGSIQWIPEQIVGIAEDFHSQVHDGKVKTTVYRVRWSGYDRTGDTWEPITHLQGYASMVKAFKESHEKDVERLAADRRREAESKEAHALKNAPKHTVLCMNGLTSPVWTLGMFQMVSGDSCQCMKRTKQSTACHITVRHAACTVQGCGFVAKYQNTSNLENHYATAGTDHKELADRLTSMQHIDRQARLGSAADGRIALSRTFVAPAFTADKKSRCDIKFVKWLVRKNRALSMSKKDDELNDFVDEVTDGAYNLPCLEVIMKLVKQMQAWGDERIKKIVAALAAEGMKLSIAADIWYS